MDAKPGQQVTHLGFAAVFQQQNRGRKINAMDAYFYQMVERVLREELAVSFGESQQEAGRRLLEVLR